MTLREAVLAAIEQPASALLPDVATPAEVIEQQAALPRFSSLWPALADACENAVLAACTQDAEYAQAAAAVLEESDFDLLWRRRVWSAVVALLARGQAPDLLALLARLGAGDCDRLQAALYHSPNAWAFDALGTVKAGGAYRRLLLLAGEQVRSESE